MNQRLIVKKLRECANGLLEVARELQSSGRMEPPRTLEIVERQIRPKDGKAHGFQLPFAVGMDKFGDDVVLELARLPHVLVGGQGAFVSDGEIDDLVNTAIEKFGKRSTPDPTAH